MPDVREKSKEVIIEMKGTVKRFSEIIGGAIIPLALVGLSIIMDGLFNFSIEVPHSFILCVALILPGISLMMLSKVALETKGGLVTDGPYAYCRNPMALGSFAFYYGIAVLLNSFSMLFIVNPLFILFIAAYIKLFEEKKLEREFGKEYKRYKEMVPMFVPRWRKRKCTTTGEKSHGSYED